MPMGCDITAGRRRASGTLDELSPIAQPAGAGAATTSPSSRNLELQNAYPGHARDVERRVPERARRRSGPRAPTTTWAPRSIRSPRSRSARTRSCRRSSWRWTCSRTVGQCDNGYACVYQNNLSWSSPTTPLPAEAHPRRRVRAPVRRRRQHGRAAGGAHADAPACSTRCSDDLARLQQHARRRRSRPRSTSTWTPSARSSGASRRPRRRRAENPLPDLDRPVGVPAAYADHARLMFDLQVLALQGDITRVITFQLARETSNRTYPRDRRARAAPPAVASRQRSREDREGGEDQHVPRLAVRRVPREAEGDAGRRRLAARPLALPLRQRHGQSRTSTTT